MNDSPVDFTEAAAWHALAISRAQYDAFLAMFNEENKELNDKLTALVFEIRKSFKSFVPKRLDSQINQWVSFFAHEIIGYVAEELIARGVLAKPDAEKPLTDGVFYVEGKYIYP